MTSISSRNNSSIIKEPQSTTITIPGNNDDDDTTLVSHSPSPSTNSLHSREISPYRASSPSYGIQHDDFSLQHDRFPLICILICLSLTIFIILIVLIINNMGVIDDNDISRIPLNYELSLKRLIPFNDRFDYVINRIPTNNERENFNNISTSVNKTNTTNHVLAELISRSLIVIPPGWYEVQEFRYNTNGTFTHKVLTTKCHMEFTLSSVLSAPDVIIQFTTHPLLNLNHVQNLTLQESMKYCKWKITWTFIMNGYIHKLCPEIINSFNITDGIKNKNTSLFDNQGYEKVAYFKGWEFFGFSFLSLDSKINYGYTTVPNILNMMSRSVYITKDAPFPPIIPAIYTAYYNYITNSRTNRKNKKKNKYNH
ncbi:hypothetical protein C1645_827737 [Glomus cerebriforme]|uniref:Uncharacterized protein n=1 Tax=Glomus cerebriforme TaxID=658196 RepID=A0A397SP46_9GLOM|nr:hypothetical protein C1645_827737 [Glomus cerebriforme]